MARVFPQTISYKRAVPIFTEGMHLIICYSLHRSRTKRHAEEDHAAEIHRHSVYHRPDRRQYTAVYDKGWNHMYAYEIDDGIKYTCLFLEHGVSPILMVQIAEGVCPIRCQTNRPIRYDYKKQNTKSCQFLTYRKCRQNNRWLNAPIGIVNRCVSENYTEYKCYNGCRYIGNQ